MPLPRANTRLSVSDIYPDRVDVAFTYRTVGIASWVDFRSVMGQAGFSRIPAKLGFRGTLCDEVFNSPTSVTASFNPHVPLMYFQVPFNPLSDFHAMRNDYTDEAGFRLPADNWLHPDEVTDNICARLLHHLTERIQALETAIWNIDPLNNGNIHLRLSAIRVSSLELCVDIGTCYPHFFLQRHASRFRERFSHVTALFYGSARSYTDLLRNSNLLRAFRVAGEEYKMYEKTTRRVRLECALNTSALDRLLPTRVIGQLDPFTIGRRTRIFDVDDLFPILAAAVLPHFNAIILRTTNDIEECGSPLEFISRLNALVRWNVHTWEQVYEALIVNNRITSSSNILDGHTLRRLVDAGLLERSVRGIYVEAPRYRAALRVLRETDERWRRRLTPEQPRITVRRVSPTQQRRPIRRRSASL